MRIAVIGAGVSGIAAAHCLGKTGHTVEVFEKSADIGGVWTLGYPDVRLQNTRDHYRLIDVPWPVRPDQHPTSGQIRQYLNDAIRELGLSVRLQHEVTQLEETSGGWRLHYRHGNEVGQEDFDFVVPSIGQYSEGKYAPAFPGQDTFGGEIITEREVSDLSVFAGNVGIRQLELFQRLHVGCRNTRWLANNVDALVANFKALSGQRTLDHFQN